MIVIDASIAVKWYREESGAEQATELYSKQAGSLLAPDLLAIEVCSALVRHANEVKRSRPEMERALAAFAALIRDELIELRRAPAAQLERAARLALGLGHPFRDCVYLALAMELGCPLITADTRFAEKASGAFTGVRLLGA